MTRIGWSPDSLLVLYTSAHIENSQRALQLQVSTLDHRPIHAISSTAPSLGAESFLCPPLVTFLLEAFLVVAGGLEEVQSWAWSGVGLTSAQLIQSERL